MANLMLMILERFWMLSRWKGLRGGVACNGLDMGICYVTYDGEHISLRTDCFSIFNIQNSSHETKTDYGCRRKHQDKLKVVKRGSNLARSRSSVGDIHHGQRININGHRKPTSASDSKVMFN